MKHRYWAFGLALLCGGAAHAAQTTVTGTLAISILPPLTVAIQPASGTVACNAPAGTVISAISTAGGDGSPVSLAISGDITDFSLSGANIVVGSGGIAAASCGTKQNVSVTASQP